MKHQVVAVVLMFGAERDDTCTRATYVNYHVNYYNSGFA